jgi:hypothetical protein
MEDPIAVPITKLEQDNYGNPKMFNQVVKEMLNGKEGKMRIPNANRLLPKVLLIALLLETKMNIQYYFSKEKCSASYLLLCKFKRI